MATHKVSCAMLAALLLTQAPVQLGAQAANSGKPVAPRTVTRKPAKPAAPAVAEPAVPQPEVLTNETVIRMIAAGLDEETVVAKIRSTDAKSCWIPTT